MCIEVSEWTATVHCCGYLYNVTPAIDAERCIPAVRIALQQLSIPAVILKSKQPLSSVLLQLLNYCRVGTSVLCMYHMLYSPLMQIALTEFSWTHNSTATYIHNSSPHAVCPLLPAKLGDSRKLVSEWYNVSHCTIYNLVTIWVPKSESRVSL
jgi:hypothetical protein